MTTADNTSVPNSPPDYEPAHCQEQSGHQRETEKSMSEPPSLRQL